MASKPRCQVPGCRRDAAVGFICRGHYQQKRRQIRALIAAGESPEHAEHMYRLTPLRGRHGQREAEPLVRMRGLRVSPRCAAAVESDPPGAREALETWAKRRGA